MTRPAEHLRQAIAAHAAVGDPDATAEATAEAERKATAAEARKARRRAQPRTEGGTFK